jgi:tetratricopeptide (TPR) repeat protein
MSNRNISSSESLQRQAALLKMLKATLTLPAQVTFYAAALGAILLIPGMNLPPALAVIAGGVGVNALSSILERIAGGESLSDNQIRTQVQAAIEESCIAEKLNTRDTQAMIARLFRQCDVIKFAIHNSEHEILHRLTRQAAQYESFAADLRDEISVLHYEVRQLATREQGEDIIELEKAQMQQIAELKSLLMQREVDGPRGIQLGDSLPTRARQQLALAQCQAELNGDSSNWRAWLRQAETYYELEEMDKALVSINRTWDLNNHSRQVASVRGCILAEYAIARGGPRSMLNEAIGLFESLRDKSTEVASIDYNIGNCYVGLNDHQRAVECFDRALAAGPRPGLAAQIWKNRGSSCSYIDDKKEEEIACYKRALELDPNLFEAYASWGAAELRNCSYQSARDLLEDAFRVDPDREMSGYAQLYSLAYALWRLGALKESYRRVNQVLALQPVHQDGLLLKAYLISQLWREDSRYVPDAIAFYEKRVMDAPDDMASRNELYLIYNSNGYEHNARSVLEETALSPSAPPQSLYHYAMLLESEDKTSEALKYLETAYELSKEHHIAHSLGRLKEKIKEYRGAIEFYEMALQDVENRVPILRSIADCYHFLGEYEECVRVLARAIIVDPRDETSWNNLGYALDQLGQDDGLFGVFLLYIAKLRRKDSIADDEAEAAAGELLSRLRVKFGEEFVLTIKEDPSNSSAR